MSWKTFGGIGQIKNGNINAKTISTDNIILKKSYQGDFNVNGNILVSNNVDICGNLLVNGYSKLNDVSMNSLFVNGNTFLNGNVTLNQTLNTNNIKTNTIDVSGNANVGSQLILNNQHYLYGNSTGIGIDTLNPTAILDIHSTINSTLNLSTTSNTNKNILACNDSNNGIVLGSSNSQTSIDFFTNGNISNNAGNDGDSYIHSNSNGTMTLKTAKDTQVLSNMIISGSQHLSNETLALYDNIQNGSNYFSNIYANTNAKLGKSTAFISSDSKNKSSTMISLTNGQGGAMVGGNYPLNSGSMLSYGLTDKSGNYLPTETIVSGSPNNTKYLATTGINTYMPRTDNYVLDINGPVHIDNGDIVVVKNTNFEILSLTTPVVPAYKNCVMAIGASIDASGSYSYSVDSNSYYGYRYSVLFSADSGATWNSTILYPSNVPYVSNAVLNGNFINNIDVYDCSYAFITGNNNVLIYTYDGGYTWQNIGVRGTPNGVNFNEIKIKPQTYDIYNNALSVYFTIDLSNGTTQYTTFDVSFSEITGIAGSSVLKNVILHDLSSSSIPPIHINSIGLGNSTVYFACNNKIIIYDLSNLNSPKSTITPDPKSISTNIVDDDITFSKIVVYNDTYAIAVAKCVVIVGDDGFEDVYPEISLIYVIKNYQIVSGSIWRSDQNFTTVDYGTYDNVPNIFTYPMNFTIEDICLYDVSNSIVIGHCNTIDKQGANATSNHSDGGFILITYDGGMTWRDMPTSLLNASGKMNMLIGSQSYLKNITIPNPNTLLISSSKVFSMLDTTKKYYSLSGASSLTSFFTPNYLNSANNHVMDICGNVSVYGSLYAKNVTCMTLRQISDYRIKNDISPLDNFSVDSLNPVQYTNIITGKRDWGFIADDLQKYLPDLVDGEKDHANYQSINYVGLIALLVKEIQDLKKRVNV
jgi:hypothetical protein